MRVSWIAWPLVTAACLSLGCDGPTSAPAAPFTPDRVCPGSPECAVGGEEPLQAGVASRVITPTVTETMTIDANGNSLFDSGDEFDDANGNGVFDAVWIAGFDSGRPANGVLDDVWARVLALRSADVTIVIVALDLVGYMYDEVEKVRAALPASLGVDYVVINATHTHQGPDTVGIWGAGDTTTGVDLAYNTWVRAQVVAAVTEAVQALAPAHVTYAQFRTDDYPMLGLANYVGDTRDPIVIDDRMTLMHFTRADTSATIGTLVNWSSHAEYIGSRNNLLSSDYPHWLRQGVEGGIRLGMGGPGSIDMPGLGGTCIFVNGAVGGQVGPGGVQAHDLLGVAHPSSGVDKAEATGTNLAAYVLNALAPGSGMTTTDTTMSLGFRVKTFHVPIKNRLYQVGFELGLFDRALYNYDPTDVVSDRNLAEVLTETAVLTLGRTEVITCPGEIFPEAFVGGYDGSRTGPIWPIVDPMLPNPPDLSAAPAPPYLVDLMGGEFNILFGLANDELGYIVPTYDFELDRVLPYFDEAPGEHYEETNSTGPDADPIILGNMTELVRWTPPAP